MSGDTFEGARNEKRAPDGDGVWSDDERMMSDNIDVLLSFWTRPVGFLLIVIAGTELDVGLCLKNRPRLAQVDGNLFFSAENFVFRGRPYRAAGFFRQSLGVPHFDTRVAQA